MKFQPQTIPLDPQMKWEIILNKPLRDRGEYLQTENTTAYQRIAGVFLGAFDDQESFEEYLYLLANEPSNGLECLFKGFNRDIDNHRFQEIQRIMNVHTNEELSINRFIAFMEGANLLPFRSKSFYAHYRETFKEILTLFQTVHGNLRVPEFRRLIVDFVKWSWNHLDAWGTTCHFEERMPRIMWYGNAKDSEVYFLYFLYLFGCDVIVFHPEGKNIFSLIPGQQIQEVKYPVNTTLFNFPLQKPQRRTTVAQKATEQLNEVMHHDNSMLYRPWQFREYKPQAITLKTTYDELFILQPEKAYLRPGFKAANPVIEIPSLFAKVNGLTSNREEYWTRVQKISTNKKTQSYTHFPIVEKYKGNMQFHYKDVLNGERISPDLLIKAAFWPYKKIATPLQLGLAEGISRLVYQAELMQKPGESQEQLRLYLFGQAMMIPEPIIQLFQQFDYSQEVPAILLYNNGSSGTFEREDAALLNLLNEIGFDVFLYNPTGQNNIELYLEPKHYDVHWLEDMSFDESFANASTLTRRTSRLKNLLNRFKN